MKLNKVAQINNSWMTAEFKESMDRFEADRNKRFLLHFIPIELYPLKVFLGWNPMKEWVSKCKPYVPSKKTDFINLEIYLSRKALTEWDKMIKEYCDYLNLSVGIPKGKEGKNEKR